MLRSAAATKGAALPLRVLHAGCGVAPLSEIFQEWECVETRLDIDPATKPDIVANMIDIEWLGIGPFDYVLCNHALEHLYPHDVEMALRGFLKVLAPGGKAVIYVPDLEDARPTDEVLFVSPAGPIAGLDLYYGHRASLGRCPYMAHHCGFVAKTLHDALSRVGFVNVGTERLLTYNLLGFGEKP